MTSTALAPVAAVDVATILAAHPWPKAWADHRRLEWLWTFDVDLPPDQLWPAIADVSRLNRALGNPPMTFTEQAGVRWGRARYAGVMHEWEEVPWNWVAGRWFELTRYYKRGGMRALFGTHVLVPHGGGTRLHVYYGVVSRGRIFELPMKLSFAQMKRAYERVLPKLVADIKRAGLASANIYHPPAPELRPEARGRLDQIRAQLVGAGQDPDAVRQLVDWVQRADDLDLDRIRVRERARVWQQDEDTLLRVCLHATRAGLFELTWDVVCPHCRGVREATGKLGELPASGHCDVCDIDFGTDSPEAIEVSFHVHSSIRDVGKRTFCSAEPVGKPHIHAQRTLAPGVEDEVELPADVGRYRLRLRGAADHVALEVEPGAPVETVAWRAASAPAPRTLGPGSRVRLVNDTGAPQIFVVETVAWSDVALRPGRLLSFQDFRDLFSEEYLGADIQLAVGEQTILFTDVVGSTAMYATRGDPAAFVEVKRHFDQVFGVIGAHRGAVVKTIGDAAMGAFNDPLDAVRAAKAIHEAFPPGRGAEAIRLRVSLNTGPCIAVRLNANVDYFGNAVNLAAKLQAAAEAWQIAISDATLAAPGVGDYLRDEGATLDVAEVAVKGVGTIAARVWTVAREA